MSTLSESAFFLQASGVLDRLDLAIERAAVKADIDVENSRQGGLLEVELEDRSKIVINIQTPMREIWVAAQAGGFHFRYETGRAAWLDTRDGAELYTVLARLLSGQSHTPLVLELN